MATTSFDLDRFLNAQEYAYPIALEEMKNGHKRSHWIWYIFPQEKGLGRSRNSEYYGLDGEGEARAYLAHPILGKRLREITSALLSHRGELSARQIMGSGIDTVKLRSCMELFDKVSANDIFSQVLDAFYKNDKND